MIIKQKYKLLSLLVITIAVMTILSCSTDKVPTCETDNFVMFQDSALVMPVTEDMATFEIAVGMMKAEDHDRYVPVVVDAKQSNAIEGYHFTIEDKNVLIPAGQLTGKVVLHGNYTHIASVDDSLAVTLRLLANDKELTSLYGNKVNVRLRKVRPFSIDDYVGNMKITCTFPYSTSSVTRYYVKTEKKDDHTLIIRHLFDDVHDITIKFTEDKANPLDQSIKVREQVAFNDEQFGPVSMASVDGAPSYYLPEDRAFILYLDAYLSHVGSFGAYYYIFEWVTEDEVLANKNGLGTLY